MDQILSALKQLMGQGGVIGSIPKPIKVSMLYLGVAIAVFTIWKSVKDPSTKIFLIIALVILALICAAYYGWQALKEKKQNENIRDDISQHSSATPRSLSDPGQRARLEDMRRKFNSGVEAYKSRGKDLYKLPWYVIVGEPGSGKTEAVRHSNVGFPPGMQDEFQGVGGTINMNWWFTNHAVLLDTAGRLMFEDVKPGETSEWKEFLNLLKKNRPNCPINGLFLVIPSDSLIKDSADSIQKKAGKIAQQLDVIQRVLDVRFPVFIIVTKCDKINGFREFFDNLTDPQLQHQMMGWSNPSPLDEPFKPELVEKHLEQVGNRLRRRRMGLMRDPVPENPDARRTDEIDTLYAFPHSLELLSSRLQRYLETIFVAGEWSAKPLFLRGIYFSSSMREGSALDAELAEAIGVSVEDLPEGKIWERERAYFLRDLFLDKVFREKGLVTRATNTKTMLRTQKIALFGFGFGGMAIFCVLAWLALSHLKNSIKDQGDYWHVVSTNGWENTYWKQSIVPIRGDGLFMSAISTNSVQIENKSLGLGEFHAKLRDLAEKPLARNIFFPGLAGKYNENRHRAQRIVFEAGIVRPLLDAARQKMSREDTDPGSLQRQPDALASLIQLESDVLTRGTPLNRGDLSPDAARKFLTVFESYIAGKDVVPDTNLVSVMSWTYTSNETAKNSWVPVRFSGRRGTTNNLAVNTAIGSGLDRFVQSATNGLKTYLSDWDQIASYRAAVKRCAGAEDALFTVADASDEKFVSALHDVYVSRENLDSAMKKLSANPLFGESVSLTNAQQKFRTLVMTGAGAAMGRVREVSDNALAANRDYDLFKEIKVRLDGVQSSISNQIAQLLQSGDASEFQQLDDNYLAGNTFVLRSDLYARCEKVASEKLFAGGSLLGLNGEQYDKFQKEKLGPIRSEVGAYVGKFKDKFSKVMDHDLKLAEKVGMQQFFTAYMAEARQQLGKCAGFPLTRDMAKLDTAESFREAGKYLKYMSDDFASPVFKTNTPGDYVDGWKKFSANVETEQAIARALLNDEGLGACKLMIEGLSDSTASEDTWRADGTWRALKLASGGETVYTSSAKDEDIGQVPVNQKLELRLIKNPNESNSATFPIATDDWGPLWLIHKYSGKRDKIDPTVWRIQLPMNAPGAKGTLRLKIKFEKPLPELENWPATVA